MVFENGRQGARCEDAATRSSCHDDGAAGESPCCRISSAGWRGLAMRSRVRRSLRRGAWRRRAPCHLCFCARDGVHSSSLVAEWRPARLPAAPRSPEAEMRARAPRPRSASGGRWHWCSCMSQLRSIWHWRATGSTLTPVEPSEAMQTIEAGRINAGFLLFCADPEHADLRALVLRMGLPRGGATDLCAWLLARSAGSRGRSARDCWCWRHGSWPGTCSRGPVIRSWCWPEEKSLPAVADWQLALSTDDLWRTFPGPIMAIATVVVAGFLIVWWLGAKGFCASVAPTARSSRLPIVSPVRIKVTDA